MAEIGHLLLLPPAAVTGRGNGIQASGIQISGIQAASESAAGSEGGARAKQFRFRVHDGGRQDQPLAGDNGLPARRADDAAEGSGGKRSAQRAGADITGNEGIGSPGGRRASDRVGDRSMAAFGTPAASFLAQLIAQEQLRPGLYDPPLRAADRAYRQAGGQPALEDSGAARFQIAV